MPWLCCTPAAPCLDPAQTAIADKVSQWILWTQGHDLPEDAPRDAQLFSDFDMAIVGAPRSRYTQYALTIRREFIHIPFRTYCTARSAVLLDFARREALFATPEFRAALGDAAKANLTAEATALAEGCLLT